MLKSFSLGLKQITKEKVVGRTLLEGFSLGLREINREKSVGKIVVGSFSVGLVEDSPTTTEVYIHRHRLL